ncbi:peptidoglycan D,D-transpeptidase FtsI family protein [Sediminivirga luteola]|uniref:peptidoglycan D,D-transpeptidase FtsI family protein n=1 Tax=Sediminivirga luteola TaxID=1774748 RepID=UPI001E5DE9E2|nr:penicillin-binding protein 2 [Sediminivirga luteola]
MARAQKDRRTPNGGNARQPRPGASSTRRQGTRTQNTGRTANVSRAQSAGQAPGSARRRDAGTAREPRKAAPKRRSPGTRPPQEPPAPPRRFAPRVGEPRRRLWWMAAASIAILALLVGQLVRIQGLDTMALAQRALEERLRTVTLPAERGRILAADGTVLAESVDRYRIVADPVNVAGYRDEDGEITGARGAAEALAPVLETTPETLLPMLERDGRYSVLARGVTSQVWDAVRELGVVGITSEKYQVRSYPAGAVAGNMVGYYNQEGTPLAGLEIAYDELLTGTDGTQQYERAQNGQLIPLGDSNTQPPVDGASIQTTIDPNIQLYAQQQAAATVREHRAEWATVIVNEVKSGRILAAAEAPYLDPNNPAASPDADLSSRIFEASVEPGSTAKIVTAAALLEEDLVTPLTEYDVADRWEAPNGERFRDSSDHPEERLTFAGIMMDSSNTGTLQAGQQLTTQQRYDYLRAFGFGQPSGIGFPGETAGILHTPEDWDGRTAYAVMFGQGMTATSLQNANAMTTLVGDGVHRDLRLVDSEVAPDGTTTSLPRDEGTRVVGQDTVEEMRKILEGVVEEGTGRSARIPGYRVGGKTGTAQAPSETGGYDGYTATFIGAAPIDDPEIVVSVIVQRPQKNFYGGQAAAPLFQQVMAYSLRSLGISPSEGEPDIYPREGRSASQETDAEEPGGTGTENQGGDGAGAGDTEEPGNTTSTDSTGGGGQ